MVVTAVLRGNLDHCRVRVIACEDLQAFQETQKTLLQIICDCWGRRCRGDTEMCMPQPGAGVSVTQSRREPPGGAAMAGGGAEL